MARRELPFVRLVRALFVQEASARKKMILLAVAAVVLFLFAFLLGGNYGLLNMVELRKERRGLAQQLRAMQAERDSLQRGLQRLRTDKSEIERIAREKYGMARPGEKVIKFVDTPAEKKKGE
ncbi:MAG: septum formation initiator family protein [Fibrobacterota bacterium]